MKNSMTILCSSEGRETKSFRCATRVFSPSALLHRVRRSGFLAFYQGVTT